MNRSLPTLEHTDRLAKAIAPLLRGGDVVALSGELGAGKTTFVRSLAQAMGVETSGVSSPTFVVANEYPSLNDGLHLVHVDAYRSTGEEDLESAGLESAIGDDRTVVAIEWPERAAGWLPQEHLELKLSHAQGGGRSVDIMLPNSWKDRPGASDLLRDDAEGEGPREARTCPVTGANVPADSPSWPYASEQARMADLYRWMSGQHQISRPLEERDLEEGVD